MVPIRNIGGNILLFIPLGFSIANMFPHFSWKKVIILGAITSLIVELIQLNMPLRSLDIDDLLLNTIGTAVGYLSFKLVKKFLVNRGKKYYEM